MTHPTMTSWAEPLPSMTPIEDAKPNATLLSPSKYSKDGTTFGNAVTDPLLTAREGAELIQVSVPTFWRWVSKKILPKPVKLGGMSRWPQSELLAVIERAKASRAQA